MTGAIPIPTQTFRPTIWVVRPLAPTDSRRASKVLVAPPNRPPTKSLERSYGTWGIHFSWPLTPTTPGGAESPVFGGTDGRTASAVALNARQRLPARFDDLGGQRDLHP